MTINEAIAKLEVPAIVANVNTVIDGQARLAEAIKLAQANGLYGPDDNAPDYVVKAVRGLTSWIEHAIYADAVTSQ